MTRIHEQMYLEFNQQKSKFNTNLEHNVTIIMIKHDSKTTWNKWFTLRFLCYFFSNQYFGRKFRSKGSAQEDYDWKR